MAEAPKMPPAPGLLSGTTATPKARLALSAKARNTASLGPPAGHGTIKLMGLLENLSCAHACGSCVFHRQVSGPQVIPLQMALQTI
jgi:hypothetical protein